TPSRKVDTPTITAVLLVLKNFFHGLFLVVLSSNNNIWKVRGRFARANRDLLTYEQLLDAPFDLYFSYEDVPSHVS
ncbi:MAG: hypothetical protein E6778_23985, partial [Niallia nealsonii]|nr:hypothetical protein [Niallia nealsonii]